MRNLFSSIIPFLGAALLVSGCAGPEQKLGRGVNNMTEITRLGELRRSYRTNHRPGQPPMPVTPPV